MVPVSLNIKNPEVLALANEVARLTGETKTEAIRKSLEERRKTLGFDLEERNRRAHEFLVEYWKTLPSELRGKETTKAEVEEYLGFGPDGV